MKKSNLVAMFAALSGLPAIANNPAIYNAPPRDREDDFPITPIPTRRPMVAKPPRPQRPEHIQIEKIQAAELKRQRRRERNKGK